MSGDIDFVITVSAPDQEQLSNVIMHKIRSLPGVLSTRSHVVLDSRIGTTPEATRTFGSLCRSSSDNRPDFRALLTERSGVFLQWRAHRERRAAWLNEQ